MRITVSSIVQRPASVLFAASQDYARRLEWDVFLSEAYLLDGHADAAVGVSSYCRSRGGHVLVSRYIVYAPPTHAAVRMTRGPWVLATFSGTWRFDPVSEAGTRVRFIYNFTCRPRWLRPLIEPVLGAWYRRDMRRRLAAFKAWAERAA